MKTGEDAYKEIEKMLYFNLLAPGQRLVYQDLAKRLNMSITPVIQALHRLEWLRIVRYEPNKGFFVREITAAEVKELTETMEFLEVHSIPSVIANLDDQGMRAIRGAFKKYISTTTFENRRELMLRDTQFHLEIIKHAQNSVIYGLLEQVFKQIYLRYRLDFLSEKRIAQAKKEHEAILTALEKRDTRETKRLTRIHIRNGMRHFVEQLHSQMK